MYRRPLSCVVVAVDESTPADRVVRLALSVERDDVHTQFVFCHVIDVSRMLARAEQEDYEIALQAAHANACSVLDLCLTFAEEAGAYGRTCIRYGRPDEEIVTVAELIAADLIVVGSRQRPWLRRVLRESVPDAIVRTSGFPVLIVQS